MPSQINSLTYRSGQNVELVFARSKPTFVNAACLAANVEKIMNVPEGAGICIFSADTDFFARADETALVPQSDTTDGSAPELNPAQWDVHDVTQLHLIAAEDAVVTLSFYI
jgi:hypothetical protein